MFSEVDSISIKLSQEKFAYDRRLYLMLALRCHQKESEMNVLREEAIRQNMLLELATERLDPTAKMHSEALKVLKEQISSSYPSLSTLQSEISNLNTTLYNDINNLSVVNLSVVHPKQELENLILLRTEQKIEMKEHLLKSEETRIQAEREMIKKIFEIRKKRADDRIK